MYVFFFLQFFLKHFSFWEELSKIWSKMYIGHHVKYLLFLSDFNETWICLRDFQKILKYQIGWKSVQWEPGCSLQGDKWTHGQTDRQTDRQAWWSWWSLFCNFSNVPNKLIRLELLMQWQLYSWLILYWFQLRIMAVLLMYFVRDSTLHKGSFCGQYCLELNVLPQIIWKHFVLFSSFWFLQLLLQVMCGSKASIAKSRRL